MTRERRLLLALLLNVAVMLAQVVFGVVARSVSLFSDAGHNLTDLVALVLSIVAVRLARRAPTPERSFGWHRSSILSAQVNAAGITAAAALIAFEAVRRLITPVPVKGGIVAVVAVVAMAVNALAAWVLSGHSHDLNMRANVLHMAGDAAASAGVAIGGGLVFLTGANRIDPAISLIIAAVIAVEALGLLRRSSEVLLESTPGDIDPERLAAAVTAVTGVDEVHDLHVWSLSAEVRALSAHVVLSGHPTLEEAQAVATQVKAAVAGPFGIAHATLELECETCTDEQAACAMEALDNPAVPIRNI